MRKILAALRWLLVGQMSLAQGVYPVVGECTTCTKDLYQDVTDPRRSWFDNTGESICRRRVSRASDGRLISRVWMHTLDPQNFTSYNEPTTYDVPPGLTEEEVERWLST